MCGNISTNQGAITKYPWKWISIEKVFLKMHKQLYLKFESTGKYPWQFKSIEKYPQSRIFEKLSLKI